MNERYFQVNVEKATPACGCDCPNLQIDIDDAMFQAHGETIIRNRKVYCVNDNWCKQLYEGMKTNENKE